MEYPLSDDIQKCLDRYRKIGVFNSALEVMGVSAGSPEDTVLDGLTYISDSLNGVPEATYLAESTISGIGDLEREAEGHLRVGYPTHGTRITLDSPVDWEGYNSASRNIRYKVQSLLACDGILRADSSRRENRWYKPGLKYIRDWVSNYIVKGNKDDYQWYDMAVGQRATKLAYIIRRSIEEEEDYRFMAPMIVAADIHIQELMKEEKIAIHSNHGLFQMAGLLALGKLLPFLTRSEGAVDFAKKKIQFMLQGHFSKEGLHKEHSPIYHVYMTNFIYSIQRSKFLEGEEIFERLAIKALEASSWLIQPDENVLPFGDSPPVNILRRADFPVNMENGRPSPPFGFKSFTEGGLVVCSQPDKLGNPDEYLAFAGSFFSRQHKHSDDMGFQFFANGKGMFTDAGTYTYQYDQEERIYIESTRAHNCLEIDGYDYSRFKADAFGSCIDYAEEVGGCIFIEGSVNRGRLVPSDIPYNKVKGGDCERCQIKQRRILFYLPGKFLIVIDDIEAKKNRNYTQWFNLFPGMSVAEEGGEVVLGDANEVTGMLRSLGDSKTEVRVTKGQEDPRLNGWISNNGHTLEKANSVGISASGKSVTIGTMVDLEFEKTRRASLNIGSGGNYIRTVIDQRDEKFEMIIRNKKDEIQLEFIDNDGKNLIVISN